jgi:DNA-binding NtrC family response regulator
MTIPGASSQEVVAAASRRGPEVKVILTSAYSEQMVRGAMNGSLTSRFIRKPFQLADLVRTIHGVLCTSAENHAVACAPERPRG